MSSTSRPILPGDSRHERPNIGVLLRVLYQQIVERVSSGLAMHGFDDIRPAHTAVFQHIQADGTRLSELAERAQMTKQSMGYLVDYLEEHGYVERRVDPGDRRATLIFLTDRGWEEVRVSFGIIAEVEREWAEWLGDGQLEHLRQLLGDLGAAVAGREGRRNAVDRRA